MDARLSSGDVAWRSRGLCTFRGRLGAVALMGLIALAGCSTMRAINPWQSETGPPNTARPQGALSQPKVDSSDPLVRLVGTMPMTVDQSFREPATGEVLRVRVLRSYAAASGRSCREFAVITPAGDEQRRVVCADGDRWVPARPLRLEAGAVRVQ